MRKTIKQLEAELAAAKQEAESWKAAHAALAKALAERPADYYPVWISNPIPWVAPYVEPYYPTTTPIYTWPTITVTSDRTICTNGIGNTINTIEYRGYNVSS